MSKNIYLIFLLSYAVNLMAFDWGTDLPDPYETINTAIDTIPLVDRQGDFINDEQYNPFDILPTTLEQTVEYDPDTDQYIIYEKIGDEYFRTPSYMTFEEYMEWNAKKEERRYFDKLAGMGSEYKSGSGKIDPMSRIDVGKNMVDRLFGGTDVNIEPQGNIDITLGYDYQKTANPAIPIDRQTFQGPNFDMDIQMNVDGSIGEKLNLGFNYNTQSTFDFDRKIKIEYDSQQFSDDDIIKKIEAGNVSLPLRSNLIQGAQSLFGIKTELQFGHLRLTGLISQQKSQNDCLDIQNGSIEEEFEIRPDEYDENRHFFISHYHRNVYEDALSNLPYINNNFRVTDIQVWISEDRPDFQQNSRMVAAITDIAEPEDSLFTNDFPNYRVDNARIIRDVNGNALPDNDANTLFDDLVINGEDEYNEVIEATTVLKSVFNLKQTRDFEVFRGRMLNASEFTFNPELGFISLNVRLQPNQVLGVSYRYFYSQVCSDEEEAGNGGTPVFKVGSPSQEFAESNIRSATGELNSDTLLTTSETLIFTKLLKSSNQRVSDPTWDLMMKNVYSLRTSQLTEEDFTFDIFYENDLNDGSLTKFLPEESIEKIPLLNVFNLDRLNSTNDPQADGIFDFVPGVTVIPRTGSIIFPVLEPFGKSLRELLPDNEEIVKLYEFPELYSEPITFAREQLHKNKFVMKGEYKSDFSSDISLGAWNIPRGSVRVRAGGNYLEEGFDYDIDYGIGRLRIINPAYLQQGVPIEVCFEDNSVFSLQQKSMMGIRADYEVNDNFSVGATMLRLSERPFTEKVNLGDDPINNRIYGLDMDFSKEAPWLTKALDKLPFFSTKEISNVNFTAEAAVLKPGQAGAIKPRNEDYGVVSIDDFEGAVSGFPLGSQPNFWRLASTPEVLTIDDDGNNVIKFEEATLVDDLAYGANRAQFNWYVIDLDSRLAGNDDFTNPFTRRIAQTELFNRDLSNASQRDLFTFDIHFDPTARGPYNFDLPGGYPGYSDGITIEDDEIKLNNPESRWGGIMRYFNNSDFQASNYEFIDFWMLNPYTEVPGVDNPVDEEGYIYFHLGNVSEDILHDNLQFFENSIPTENLNTAVKETSWGTIPLDIPINNAFGLQDREEQDLGFDGLDDGGEALKFKPYIDSLSLIGYDATDDPANDNFQYFKAPELVEQNLPLIERYKRFNNPEGNFPDGDLEQRGNQDPDIEDLNNNKSLDQAESFYSYRVKIKHNGSGAIDLTDEEVSQYVIDQDSVGTDELWYRVRIPLNEGKAVNGIEGFRSIQFIRMLTTGFSSPKTFRMAEFELVRNQWRKNPPFCDRADEPVPTALEFSIDEVGVEESSQKEPFNYVKPPGIVEERFYQAGIGDRVQDENSLSMRFCGLDNDCQASIYKLTEIDLRLFDNLQLHVHAEGNENRGDQWDDEEMYLFVRVGKDFVNNYYEYEIPLVRSTDQYEGDAQSRVWRPENRINFPLSIFTEIKKLKKQGLTANDQDEYILDNSSLAPAYDSLFQLSHVAKMKGNPSLGFIKGVEIGIRNKSDKDFLCGEVWINELRAAGLNNRGGVAGQARLDVQLADLGSFSSSINYNSIGWGALDQKLAERALDQRIEYDFAANLELGKFFPEKWNLRVPFYGQYAKAISNQEYDAFDLDIKVDELLELETSAELRDAIKQRSQDVTTIKTINFINVKKERGSGASSSGSSGSKPISSPGRSSGTKNKEEKNKISSANVQAEVAKPKKKLGPMPWDISNFSFSYSYTEMNHRDAIMESEQTKDYKLGIDYTFNVKSKFIQPFKFIKIKPLKFIKEINFNPIPNSFTFSSNINRYIANRKFRLPDEPVFTFDDRRFDWQRRYGLNWDLAKALKFNFTADNLSYIDELRQIGIKADPVDRDWINERGDTVTTLVRSNQNYVSDYWKDNFKQWGRNKSYRHQMGLSYNVPMKVFPILDWIGAKASYKAEYAWDAGPLIVIDESLTIEEGREPGAVISNSQNRKVDFTFNFDKLYRKVKFLKKVETGARASSRTRSTRTSRSSRTSKNGEEDDKKKKEKEPSKIVKAFVRPLLMLRTVKFSYREDFGTTVPGFLRTPSNLGLGDSWSSPGWDFVTGVQPDITYQDENNWLFSAAEKGWISRSSFVNQQVSQNRSQNYELNIDIEPFKYFKIDIDFKKNHRVTHTEEFKIKPGKEDFQQLALLDQGSFDVSYLNIKTLFGYDRTKLFDRFEDYRKVISVRLQAEAAADGAVLAPHSENSGYIVGFGEQSYDVLVPAFLAAYSGSNPNNVALDLEKDISRRGYLPAPNWKIRYDGLNKLPWFKDVFSSFRIDHGYKSQLQVNSFAQDVEYIRDPSLRYQSFNLNASSDYYSRITMPSIAINEQFLPLIGFSMETKSKVNLDFEYNKSRILNLRLATSQLDETLRSEISFGAGFVFKNVSLFSKASNSRPSRSSRNNETKEPEEKGTSNGRRGRSKTVNNSKGKDLVFSIEMAISDDELYNHQIDGESLLTRGMTSIRIGPALDYELNENVGLRFFMDYNRTKPKTGDSFPITAIEGGFTVQMKLN